jgi:hypothetical protein
MSYVNFNPWKMTDTSYIYKCIYLSINDHFNELTYREINLLSLNNNSLEIYSPRCCLSGED